ncbi:MAG TPA: Flp family type IVb pilin [Firmicutes bacterium]|nr:Flp family type IVb pilin [Bacillota bacterium]
MLKLFKRLFQEESGQSMVEYALIIALVALVAAATLTTLGNNIKTVFQKAADNLK